MLVLTKVRMPDTTLYSSYTSRRSVLGYVAPFGLVGLLVGLAVLPVATLIWIALDGSSDVWPHLLNYVLPATMVQTLMLLLLVAFGTTIIGAGTAWLVTICHFPMKRFFNWALVLPLAVPTYIAAYTHVEFLDFSGPVQSLIREIGGFATSRDYWFPDIRSTGGAALIFSLVLYPYVYLTCRLVFSMQGASALDVCRSLGASPARMFWRVGLPMARPAVAAGVAVALMETLNDIGAVEILGVKTLTYAVFETWLNRDNLTGAMQLAILTLLLVAGLIWLERIARRGRGYNASVRERPPAQLHLTPLKQALAFAACALPILGGLGAPLFILGSYAARRMEQLSEPDLINAITNSLTVALLSAALATAIAYGVLQYARISRRNGIATVGRMASLGYAVPGTVLALGLLIAVAGFDNWLDGVMQLNFGVSTGLLLSGSIVTLIYAYTLRFLAIAYGTIESGFARLSHQVDCAARALGRTPMQLALQVHTPILRKALAAAFLLVFVDSMKELSATLLLRPFDFETLATMIYDRASQAALEEAATAALLIVIIGLVPMVLLSNIIDGQHGTKKTRTLLPALGK